MKALVYTRHADKGVSICHPVTDLFAYMTRGGGYWNDRPRGFLDELIRRKTCPILQKGTPASQEAAVKFVRAMQFGGLTTAEAWDVFRLHDCERYGFNVDMIDTGELPDRWFRDAWGRSANGGPVTVDMAKARAIQWERIADAVSRENKRREMDLFGLAPIRLRKLTYQTAIKNARDDEELRCIWPKSLPLPSLALRSTV